jgi:hypothetical protein
MQEFGGGLGGGRTSPVPRNQSGAVPISSLLSVGCWGSGKLDGWDNWVKGGANRVSLQAT